MDPLLFAVFSNRLVWRKLGEYLNYSDLKACRGVCKVFDLNVVEETFFKSRTIITLRQKHIVPSDFGSTTVKWTNIEILPFHIVADDDDDDDGGKDCNDEDKTSRNFNWLYPLLSNVETLIIGGKDVYSDEIIFPPIQKLLEAPNMLKKLSVDVSLLSGKSDVFKSPSAGVRRTLEGLSEFIVDAFVHGPLTCGSDDSFFDSIGMIGTLVNNLQLIKVENIVAENFISLPNTIDEDMHWKLQNLLRIIEVSRATLKTLQLRNVQLWSTTENAKMLSVAKINFPLLKTVKIRVVELESQNIIDFLKAHPQLEEIDLTVLNSLSTELMAVLGEGERNLYLRRLRIATKILECSQSTSWNFLTKLEKLEEFQLNLIKTYSNSYLDDCVAATIFSNLPQSVKRITLRGLSNSTNQIPTLVSTDLANLNPSVVTVLNLSKCFDVNDEAIEFICRNFKSLINLNLSDIQSCTDYGFTGLPIDWWSSGESGHSPFSIADIKGLKSLTLRACGSITDVTLIEGIKFLELRFLDVCNNPKITEDGCLKVLQQNPSLEILQTRNLDEFPSEEELKKTCSRLKQHTYPHDDYSEDDDASANDFESDFSGGGYDPHDLYGGGGYDDFEDDFDDDYDDDYENEEDDTW